jgi:amino acid permease
MGTNTATVMTLANSIIGVGVLAMPFCFKQVSVWTMRRKEFSFACIFD